MVDRSKRISSLYVHVPFCARKCSYCAFYSEPTSPELVERYVEALTRELEFVSSDLKPLTVFFGGGTPSLLTLKQWTHVFQAMERLGISGAGEFTIECNPATVSLDKAKLWLTHGVNRVSMGVQSLDADLLKRLGRVHTRDMAFRSWDVLRKAGFDNLNLDLMFAIPGQTLEVWRGTLKEVMAMGSEHVSCYEVIYEEDTPLWTQLQAGNVRVDEDLACSMYEELLESASAAGFRQYEIANLARDWRAPAAGLECEELVPGDNGSELPAYACKHNVNYWRGGWFYGAGPSATSYVRGRRWKNWSNTVLYCEQIERASRPQTTESHRPESPALEWSEELGPLSRAGETAAFGLRMTSGWPLPLFRRVTGFDLQQEWRAEVEHLVQQGWAEISDQNFRLTRAGLRFADTAAEMFLRPERG